MGTARRASAVAAVAAWTAAGCGSDDPRRPSLADPLGAAPPGSFLAQVVVEDRLPCVHVEIVREDTSGSDLCFQERYRGVRQNALADCETGWVWQAIMVPQRHRRVVARDLDGRRVQPRRLVSQLRGHPVALYVLQSSEREQLDVTIVGPDGQQAARETGGVFECDGDSRYISGIPEGV